MRLVVVVKRDGQVLQRRSRVRLGHPRDVVSLHCFDEALSHPVALRTSDRRRDGFQAHLFRECQRLLGNVAGSVVAEPFDFVVGLQRTTKTVFHSLKHDITHRVTGIASSGRSPAHGIPVAAVQCKDDAQRRAVITTELEAVRAPARIAPVHGNLAAVPAR
jgi:hypothetical protein